MEGLGSKRGTVSTSTNERCIQVHASDHFVKVSYQEMFY